MHRTLLVVLLLAGACSFGPSTDIVVYRAAPETFPGGVRTRSLLVTGGRRVLGVERKPDGAVAVRIGGADGDDYRRLTTSLAAARHLGEDATPAGLDTVTFQISADLGAKRIRIERAPARLVEKDVASAVSALEAIWDAAPESADPVTDLEPFLASDLARVRGQAANALLQLFGSSESPPALKEAAERSLRRHLEVEDDRQIVHGIRDVIDQTEIAPGD